VQVWRA